MVEEGNEKKPKQSKKYNFGDLVDFLESGSEFEPDLESTAESKSKPRRVVSSGDEVMSG